MKHDTKEMHRITSRLAKIDQKCDLILAHLSTLRTHDGLDSMIDRLHRQAKAMRRDSRR